jgi:hypothetical protein
VKVSHLIFLILAGLGIVFLWHQYKFHGGLGGFLGSGTAS